MLKLFKKNEIFGKIKFVNHIDTFRQSNYINFNNLKKFHFSTKAISSYRIANFATKVLHEKKLKKIPAYCNIFKLSSILEVDTLTLINDFQESLKTEILDVMQYISRDDIELFLLEKGIDFEFLNHKSSLRERPMVVTIMGHVDHGKTTLLDTFRNSSLVDNEFGKITQSIGAFNLNIEGNEITFIDTPGHEAFSKMRQRGAKVTDCIILVISAIEGVQNQTVEVIDIIKNNNIPVIIAINKIDRNEADPDKIYYDLSDRGIIVKKLGGKVPSVEISARNKINIDKLSLELINMSKSINLKEETNIPAQAFVIESKSSKIQNFINPVASVIIKKGILKEGDAFICGDSYGKIKSINNDRKEFFKEALPGMAVEILGFKKIPQSGNVLTVLDDIKDAQVIIESREKLKEFNESKKKMHLGKGFKLGKLKNSRERHRLMRKGDKNYLQEKIESVIFSDNNKNEDYDEKKLREIYLLQSINKKKIILNTDTIGILESIQDELFREFDENTLNDIIIDTCIGNLNDEDFKFAQNSNSVFFCFNQEQELGGFSDSYNVGVRKHKLIYNIVDEIKYFIQEANLYDHTSENSLIKGKALIKEIFKIKHNNKLTLIAGSEVTSGNIYQSMRYRLIRKNEVYKLGLRLASMKQNKQNVNVVYEGQECGLIFDDYEDIVIGDRVESYSVDSQKEGITNTKNVINCY